MKKKLRKFLAVMMTFLLVATLFAPMVSAEENGNGEEEAPLVNPLPISQDPHVSNYEKYPALLDNGVPKASEGGALSLKEVNGQMTLVDKNNNPIQLRGMSTHGLQWFGEIVNENAFAALADDWGSNMIRLALYVGENGYATRPELINKVYDGIDLAIENDMYVIVDWHVHAPGDPRADVYSGAEEFFLTIAEKYPNNPNILYELANEPSSNNNGGPGITNDEAGWEAVKEYADPIVEALRNSGNADDNIIIVGSPNWSQRPDLAADNPIDDHHTMYTVHFYTGTHNGTNDSYPEETPSDKRSNVMANAKYALDNGVAVFATEWGVSEANGDNGPYLNEADIWLNFLNKNNISWANWSLTNKNETSGSFTPFQLNVSEATPLDPGDGQVWTKEQLSLSGEYVRSRIIGEEYEPIDRTPRETFTEVIWDFNDGTTQGFGVNAGSTLEGFTVTNENNALQIAGISEANSVWDVRISADNWDETVDIAGAQELSMEIIVDEPTMVEIGAIPQSASAGWANPVEVAVSPEDFDLQEDGNYMAVLTLTAEDAPNLSNIANSSEDSLLNNIILLINTEDADAISLDNISVSGDRESIPEPVVHDEKGTATLPSTFEDGTRQGWDWHSESGVKTSLTIEEANGSNALSWEYAYPEVKPSDGWATAPRLDFWKDNLVRGDNEFVAFDFYIDPVEERATEGEISINLTFQPPSMGFWAQAPSTFDIDLEALDEATLTEDGLYHFEVEIDITNITNLQDDTELRNMMLIFADGESDFAGRVYVDNVRFDMSLEKKVEVLSRTIAELLEQIETIEADNAERIAELEDQIAELEEQLNELVDSSVVEELQRIIEDLLAQIAALEQQVQELKDAANGVTPQPGNGDGSSDDVDNGTTDGGDNGSTDGENNGSEEGESGSTEDEDSDSSDGAEETGSSSKEGKDGEKLPNTATNMFNFLMVGLMLLAIGIVTFVIKRKNVAIK
ncbi:carbohydrate-binding domain-containing protein [Evansella cellulosilytica]|uniref:cellulase n=1 Tax=Evansella cellulosilytica (strain ATCC 21833 / DSM 2522 / FERM P-1141 / JCM 9156 / N-4) TaxID=649639 RepID=E6U1W6_EVAC2|nr:carbohydrate-binding domain-containing protein [Evansella cellulosilytica]ADU31613.1 LPXTG-motif cell wall anchor domain protein [Evansella cellulosilytica DSM 2522]